MKIHWPSIDDVIVIFTYWILIGLCCIYKSYKQAMTFPSPATNLVYSWFPLLNKWCVIFRQCFCPYKTELIFQIFSDVVHMPHYLCFRGSAVGVCWSLLKRRCSSHTRQCSLTRSSMYITAAPSSHSALTVKTRPLPNLFLSAHVLTLALCVLLLKAPWHRRAGRGASRSHLVSANDPPAALLPIKALLMAWIRASRRGPGSPPGPRAPVLLMRMPDVGRPSQERFYETCGSLCFMRSAKTFFDIIHRILNGKAAAVCRDDAQMHKRRIQGTHCYCSSFG